MFLLFYLLKQVYRSASAAMLSCCEAPEILCRLTTKMKTKIVIFGWTYPLSLMHIHVSLCLSVVWLIHITSCDRKAPLSHVIPQCNRNVRCVLQALTLRRWLSISQRNPPQQLPQTFLVQPSGQSLNHRARSMENATMGHTCIFNMQLLWLRTIFCTGS